MLLEDSFITSDHTYKSKIFYFSPDILWNRMFLHTHNYFQLTCLDPKKLLGNPPPPAKKTKIVLLICLQTRIKCFTCIQLLSIDVPGIKWAPRKIIFVPKFLTISRKFNTKNFPSVFKLFYNIAIFRRRLKKRNW